MSKTIILVVVNDLVNIQKGRIVQCFQCAQELPLFLSYMTGGKQNYPPRFHPCEQGE